MASAGLVKSPRIKTLLESSEMRCSRGMIVAVLLLALFPAKTALPQRITATWQDQQLDAVLERIASTTRTAIWLDCRVDPSQPVTAQFADAPVEAALAELAARRDLGLARLGKITYIGPAESAAGLAAFSRRAHTSLRRAHAAQQRRWLQAAASSWPRLSEPRELATALAQQANATLVGAELIPHDLWPARELPSLPLVDRLALVLVGFNLTCEISPDGKTCRIVPLELLPAASQSPPPLVPPRVADERAAPIQQQFSLRLVNQSVGRVIDQLATQLKLEVVWDDAALQAQGLSRASLTSCEVVNADLDGLLRAVLTPVRMEFTRDGQQVKIRAAGFR